MPKNHKPQAGADAFAFSDAHSMNMRLLENTTTMMAAPWRAYWALTMEALDPKNYRHGER